MWILPLGQFSRALTVMPRYNPAVIEPKWQRYWEENRTFATPRLPEGEKLYVLEIDAAERPEAAKTWGVMSVPTTFLLDERGVARYVNHGVTRAETLMEQIQSLQA